MTTPQSVEKMLREFEWQFENRVRTNQSLREEAPWMFSWLRTTITTNRQQAFEEGVKAERERIAKWLHEHATDSANMFVSDAVSAGDLLTNLQAQSDNTK